ncbi:hypothetical protein [Rhodobacter ferrooxidans]|uniref:PA14 domain-containing protein n=1 Tax=Rhodobacter ferrooxidans TaxID=371731 RepID=C8RYX4_9RHOB|nr:hypothetical protein [Rhodobacter sp. SW2]EEW25931.1 hypothetical protein Rsw2DRAFT_1002 [Rhodobacter sp. SW2]
MPTERGFVEALGVGRAGLVEATVLHADGSTQVYTVADLDADPERFNERLSKLGILRDAMNRAEPVEIIYDKQDDQGRAIDAVKRLTRDALDWPRDTSVAQGTVVGVGIEFEVNIGPHGEAADRAKLALLTDAGVEIFTINLQAPERGVALAMVDLARAAQAAGASVAVTYDVKQRQVVMIEQSDLAGLGGNGAELAQFSAFVEEITHMPISNLMLIAVTTAPEFSAAGNVVPLDRFAPERLLLAVVQGSPEYALLNAALRDKLRVEVFAAKPAEKPKDGGDINHGEVGTPVYVRRGFTNASPELGAARGLPDQVHLVRGVTLQHALCSASRPVWITVNRQALDIGPDANCAEGLPSSDMRPRSLREINLPYRAAWVGKGCFNAGVYRIQIVTDRVFTLWVDGAEICVHLDEEGKTAFGHACLCGEHEIRIVFENWQCNAKFDMDVYRIR